VYVKNSYKTEGFGFPFGFLKASTQKNAVTLTVVAYNYPALFTLLGTVLNTAVSMKPLEGYPTNIHMDPYDSEPEFNPRKEPNFRVVT